MRIHHLIGKLNASVVVIVCFTFGCHLWQHMWLWTMNRRSCVNLKMIIQSLILWTLNHMIWQFIYAFLNFSLVIFKSVQFLIIIIFSNAGLLHKFSLDFGVRTFAEFYLLHGAQSLELFDAIDAAVLLFQHLDVFFLTLLLILIWYAIQLPLYHLLCIAYNRQQTILNILMLHRAI